MPEYFYHFLQDDWRSGYGSEHRKPWKIGQTRRVRGDILPCHNGLHASPTLWDALGYAPGPVACIVTLGGGVTPHGNPVDKYAARSRTLVCGADLSSELRLFAADCAERVLPIFEAKHPGDARPRDAIAAARAFAARGAARDAAWDAARDAAWAAARAAAVPAARDAAGAAARDAAGAAARAIAGAAAWAAAGAAAWDVAWDAARAAAGAAAVPAARAAAEAAECEWQRQHFTDTVQARLHELMEASR